MEAVTDIAPQCAVLRIEDIAAVNGINILITEIQRQVAFVVDSHGRVVVVVKREIPQRAFCCDIRAVRERVLGSVIRHQEE